MADALRMHGIRPDAEMDSGVTVVASMVPGETGA